MTDAKGRLSLPGLTIEPPPRRAKVQTNWKSVLILTWFARYEADEPTEFTFKMVVDAGTGKPYLTLSPDPCWMD